jgi:hypothetical protein
VVDDLGDLFDGRDRLHMAHGITAAHVEEPRCQPCEAHLPENPLGALYADPPVLRVAALRPHVEGHPCQVRFERRRFGDDPIDLRRLHPELARERPVAAHVGRLDADVQLRVGLDAVNLAQLLDAVERVPLDALRRRVAYRVAGLHRVAVADLGRRHLELEEDIELRDRGDLEARALVDQDLQHPRIRIGLDGIVRMNARHSRLEAASLGSDDVRVYQQEGLGIAALQRIPYVAEVQADFRMRVEELGLLGFGWGWLLEGDRAHGHLNVLLETYSGTSSSSATSTASRHVVAHVMTTPLLSLFTSRIRKTFAKYSTAVPGSKSFFPFFQKFTGE